MSTVYQHIRIVAIGCKSKPVLPIHIIEKTVRNISTRTFCLIRSSPVYAPYFAFRMLTLKEKKAEHANIFSHIIALSIIERLRIEGRKKMQNAPLDNKTVAKTYETTTTGLPEEEKKKSTVAVSDDVKSEQNSSAEKTLNALKSIGTKATTGGVQASNVPIGIIAGIIFFIWAAIILVFNLKDYMAYSYLYDSFEDKFYGLIRPLLLSCGYIVAGVGLIKQCDKMIIRIGAIILAAIISVSTILNLLTFVRNIGYNEASSLFFILASMMEIAVWVIIILANSSDRSKIMNNTKVILLILLGCSFVVRLIANMKSMNGPIFFDSLMFDALPALLVIAILFNDGVGLNSGVNKSVQVTNAQNNDKNNVANEYDGGVVMNNVELLKQYKELLDEGIITQEEFETKRAELLADMTKVNQSNAGGTAQSNVPVKSTTQTVGTASNESTTGWAVLGFFIPLVGLILFLVWNNTEPAKAKSAGKGALIGVIVGVVGWIIYGVVLGGMIAGGYY